VPNKTEPKKQTRVKVNNLRKDEKELTREEKKKVKGGWSWGETQVGTNKQPIKPAG
jgi:hypothetical protein